LSPEPSRTSHPRGLPDGEHYAGPRDSHQMLPPYASISPIAFSGVTSPGAFKLFEPIGEEGFQPFLCGWE
jgi:hypothetical protein